MQAGVGRVARNAYLRHFGSCFTGLKSTIPSRDAKFWRLWVLQTSNICRCEHWIREPLQRGKQKCPRIIRIITSVRKERSVFFYLLEQYSSSSQWETSPLFSRPSLNSSLWLSVHRHTNNSAVKFRRRDLRCTTTCGWMNSTTDDSQHTLEILHKLFSITITLRPNDIHSSDFYEISRTSAYARDGRYMQTEGRLTHGFVRENDFLISFTVMFQFFRFTEIQQRSSKRTSHTFR